MYNLKITGDSSGIENRVTHCTCDKCGKTFFWECLVPWGRVKSCLRKSENWSFGKKHLCDVCNGRTKND